MKLKPKLVLAFLLTALIVVIAGTIWFSQKQAPLEKVTYAIGSGLHKGPVYIAIEKGYFKNEGLDVMLQEYNTGKEALNAVIKGKAELSTSAETPIMLAAVRGEKIDVIATLVDTDKDVVIVARKDRGISWPRGLKGKKIGVSIGTNGEFFMDAFLISHGISRNEVEVVNLSPKEMIDALTKGEVDAVQPGTPM